MTQCSLCQYLGPWVLTELEAEKQKRRNDPSYYAYRQDLIYHHHPTWERLRKSASGGCTFCCHIVDAFHDYGITDGRIAELQEQGKGTDVSIRKGVYDDMLRLQCGILRPHGLLIGTYVLPDDPAAYPSTTLPGLQHMGSSTASDATFAIISKWINRCVKNHKKCFTAEPDFLPTRLIDVGPSSGTKEPCLVESKALPRRFRSAWSMSQNLRRSLSIAELNSPSVRYVTLSHCWGESKHLVTEKNSLEERRAAILLSSMPKTFKDAVFITRKLGVRYLWIDSLCIIQDSPSDWEMESANMGSVYKNAFVTIAASGARNDDQGCLFERRPACQLPYNIVHPSHGTIVGSIWVRPWLAHGYEDIDFSPLSPRGWVTQERLLPSRILHFGTHQVYWECRSEKDKEDPHHAVTVLGAITNPSASEFSQFSSLNPKSTEEKTRLLGLWYQVVNEYSPKLLTKGTDKLPAISGLAEQYQKATGDTYCAGLWKADLIYGLSWESLISDISVDVWSANRPLKRPPAYRAPSWSWASLDSIAHYHIDMSRWQSDLKVIEASTTPLGINTLGEVSGGYLTVSGSMLPVRVTWNGKSGNEATVFHGQTEEKLGSFQVEDFELKPKLWCLCLSTLDPYSVPSKGQEGSEPTRTICSLVLELTDDSEAQFRRVGFLRTDGQPDMYADVGKAHVTII